MKFGLIPYGWQMNTADGNITLGGKCINEPITSWI